MPFYEYECQSCKFYTELMQKISDPPLTKCPSCGKRTMQKLVSAPVFRLKGSGWYETDFKSDKENKRNLAADREEPKPAAEEPKAEAKAPATESAAKPAEPKAPSITTSVSAGAPKRRPAAAPKRPAAAKAAARPASSSRAKAKPAARGKATKRGSRR
ncbi:MAG TPA: FmdB family zinc ribbon protein [Steroidobacteraceae bacterium]|nr:FmdB family zinc ribbon protein [Steroidobacteraceae bacterium]